MTSSCSSRSCSSTVAMPGRSRPVNALTREASVMAAMRWLTPDGSISLILATTSSGVPAKDSRSASSGLVELDALREVAARDRVDDRLELGRVDAVARQLLRGHRGGVDADHAARGVLRGRGVPADGEDDPGAEVEGRPVLAGLLGADPQVLGGVVVRLAGVAQGVVAAVGVLRGGLEGAGPAHRAHLHRDVLLHRTGEGEQAVVGEELAVEGDGALVEQGPDDVHPLDDPRERLHRRPVHAVLRQQAEVAAGQHHLGATAGQLVEGGRRLRDEGGLAEHRRRTRWDRSGSAWSARPPPRTAATGPCARSRRPRSRRRSRARRPGGSPAATPRAGSRAASRS